MISLLSHDRRRRSIAVLSALLLALGSLAINPAPAGAVDPADFTDELIVGGFNRALSMDFLPNGKALVAAKSGGVYLADIAAGTQSLYLTVPNVESTGERGLLDILVHPDFANNGYFYVYYSIAPSTQLHVDRYTFTGNATTDAASRTVIWTNPGPLHSAYGQYHIGGSLNIGPDNMFYLSVGDGFQSANAQLTTNVFGKILRFGQDGTVPTDNSWYDGAGPNIDEIWALGVRNPFRADFDEVTGRYFIGDVGGNQAAQAYEEIDLGVAGANYGWPNCEGPVGQPKNGPVCPAGVTGPIHYYAHDPLAGCCQNAAITGGEVVRGTTLPADMQGAYVFADSVIQDFRYLTFNPDGSVATNGTLKSGTGKRPTWIGQGPDGHIYYVHFSYTGATSELRRLRYTGAANQPPTITTASATPTSGPAPLSVQFTGAATDPEGDPIAFLWTFGDGTTSTLQNPLKSYAAGAYTASLKVTAAGQMATSSSISINSGNAPVVTITSPTAGSPFIAGQTINVAATATDDGPLNNSSYSWDVQFVHDNHEHPAASDITGPSFTFTVPDSGHDFTGTTAYKFQVTVTDSIGLQTIKSVQVNPTKRNVNLAATQAVGTISVDGIGRSLPFTLDTLQGFRHSLAAPQQTCGGGFAVVFNNWSDGGAATHQYVVPAANSSVTATYNKPATPYTSELTCTGDPIGQVVGPPNQAMLPNAPVTLNFLVTDDVELSSASFLIRDETSGQYWNQSSSQFQTGSIWNPLPNPPAGSTRYEPSAVFAGAPANGGLYRVRVRPVDKAGNSLNGPITFFNVSDQPPVDTTAPVVTFDTPTQNQVFGAGPVTLRATLTDNQAVSGLLFAVIDSGTGKTLNQSTGLWASGLNFITPPDPPAGQTSHQFSYSFNPATGSGFYYTVAVGFDAAANQSNVANRTFVIGTPDAIAPTATIQTPTPGQSFPAGPVNLQATISDNAAAGISLLGIVDSSTGKMWKPSTGTWASGLQLFATGTPPFNTLAYQVNHTFNPATGSGNYRFLVVPYDMARNKGAVVVSSFTIAPAP